MSPTAAERKENIIACQRRAIDGIHQEMDRLNTRIREIDEKILDGGVLSKAEKAEKKELFDSIAELSAIEGRTITFHIGMLDRTAEVRHLIVQIEAANKELTDIKTRVEDISAKIRQANDFINGLAGVIGTLTGLLKAFV